MRPPLPWALALLLAAPLTHAADSNSAAAKTTKSTRSTSDDSDEGDTGKSGGFFGRLFGKGQEAQTNSTKKTQPSPAPASNNKAEAKSEVKTEAKPEAKQEPKNDSKVDPKADPKSKKTTASKEKVPAPSPEPPKTEDERFAIARKAASEDPKVVELRNKADAAVKDSEAAKLTRAYLRTMYGKMRTLEPTLKERIDLTEAAALRLVPEAAQ